jgi:hypothetical protein
VEKLPCSLAWTFHKQGGRKLIVLEAVADQHLWIWHAYFGLPGGSNDLNVLDRSPLVNNFLRSEADEVGFVVNNRQYGRYYLRADGIYPDWSIFVKTITLPQGANRKWFAKCQEGARKDVERAFGVLHQRFAIVKNPVRMHYQHEIKDILFCCFILHNMIIEDERDDRLPADWDVSTRAQARKDLSRQDWQEYLAATRAIEDTETHFGLRSDLIAHLWELKGQGHRFEYVGDQDGDLF